MSALVLTFSSTKKRRKEHQEPLPPIALKAARLVRVRPFIARVTERMIDRFLAETDEYESDEGA